MNISVNWLNRYLDRPIDADEAISVLTHAGFPLEGYLETTGDDDTGLDLEITSNRGDCLCHIGIAREVTACTDRTLVMPTWDEPARSGNIRDVLTLENRVPDACPLFTAQVIRGAKIGASPAWLAHALEAVGQRPINNVVDVTNYLTFEFGQPSHVFDLNKLAGQTLIIRFATPGEQLTSLDGKKRELRETELVVADAQRAQSLAGVIGGADSEVDDATTDIVLEAATWDPVTIRTAARRMAIMTDAGFRFERIVDPRTIDVPARRAAALIAQLTGGTLCEGMLAEGAPFAKPTVVTLRPQRARDLIGIHIDDDEMARLLIGLEIGVEKNNDALSCTVPPFRPDLKREVDLIEEVARTKGYEAIPVSERLDVIITHPQESERAIRGIGSLLTGLGFYETVTFSFTSPKLAEMYLADGMRALAVDDERRKAEPTLRPSLIPSLLACRRANQDARVDVPGGVRLFEISAVFAESVKTGQASEHRSLTMLADIPGVAKCKRAGIDQKQAAVRALRGVIEALSRDMAGADAAMSVEQAAPTHAGYDPASCGRVVLDDQPIGWLGLVSEKTWQRAGLDGPVVAAELDLDALVSRYPPAASVRDLPAYPPIERDLSLIVDERTPWSRVADLVEQAKPDMLDSLAFVGVYRGKQVGQGKKSVTLRLRFRASDRTLRHEEVDPQITAFVERAQSELGAELRA